MGLQDVKCNLLQCVRLCFHKAEHLKRQLVRVAGEQAENGLAETAVTSAERLRCHCSSATEGHFDPRSKIYKAGGNQNKLFPFRQILSELFHLF